MFCHVFVTFFFTAHCQTWSSPPPIEPSARGPPMMTSPRLLRFVLFPNQNSEVLFCLTAKCAALPLCCQSQGDACMHPPPSPLLSSIFPSSPHAQGTASEGGRGYQQQFCLGRVAKFASAVTPNPINLTICQTECFSGGFSPNFFAEIGVWVAYEGFFPFCFSNCCVQ